MSGAVSRHLLRLCRSIPLPTLKQGTTLSFRSRIPNVSLRIESEWREDGKATLVQRFPELTAQKSPLEHAEMVVSEEADRMTSLGRSESYLSIWLQPALKPFSLEDERNLIERVEEDVDFSGPRNEVTLQVPEKVNLICELDRGGNIHIASKIEGDAKLVTSDGNIRVKKLRGHTIELKTKTLNGYIHASDLLEAQNLRIQLGGGGRLRTKRIHGDVVDVRVSAPPQLNERDRDWNNNPPEPLDDDDEGSLVDVSSMYISGAGGAQIVLEEGLKPAKRGVRIKSHHGPVAVHAGGVHKPARANNVAPDEESGQTLPLVELGSVNGSCEVFISGVPDGGEGSEDWVACQVHYDSISPESVSCICTESGSIGLTIDRKLEADIRLLSSLEATSLRMKTSFLADDDDSQQVLTILSEGVGIASAETSQISIQTQSFTMRELFVSLDGRTEYVEGWVENKSNEPDSRFEMKTRGENALQAVGKIRLDGAANQALKNFSTPEESVEFTRPLIVAGAAGRITLESLSWLGAIARRYGIDEKGRESGRQATRRGRLILPADE